MYHRRQERNKKELSVKEEKNRPWGEVKESVPLRGTTWWGKSTITTQNCTKGVPRGGGRRLFSLIWGGREGKFKNIISL